MRAWTSPRSAWAALVTLMLPVAGIQAATVIEHAAAECAVAEQFPRLEARLDPPDAVARVQVFFRPERGAHWYAVAMTREGASFAGVLPKPKSSLKAFDYYIEAVGDGLETARTKEYTTRVAHAADDCRGQRVAASTGLASVLLLVPSGAPAVPAGFSASGLAAAAAAGGGSAAGTGVPTALVVGAGGAAAAGAALVAASSGPEPTPRPTPSYGQYYGGYAVSFVYQPAGSEGSESVCGPRPSTTLTLAGNADGTNFTVHVQATPFSTTFRCTLAPDGRFDCPDATFPIYGQTDGTSISGRYRPRINPTCVYDYAGRRL